MTMNRLWRNDRSLLAEQSSYEPHNPAGPLGAAEGLEVIYLRPEEIHAWLPYTSVPEPAQRREALRGRLLDIGCWTPEQIAGKRWNIGCVALEITQRCNLDCTLCYLSDTSEAVKDVPLQEVFRRIEMIYRHYGENTDVQVTGGGHPRCNRYAMAFEINGNLYAFFDAPAFIVPLMNETAEVRFDRRNRRAAVRAAIKAFAPSRPLVCNPLLSRWAFPWHRDR